jgi:hypothetical protein
MRYIWLLHSVFYKYRVIPVINKVVLFTLCLIQLYTYTQLYMMGRKYLTDAAEPWVMLVFFVMTHLKI